MRVARAVQRFPRTRLRIDQTRCSFQYAIDLASGEGPQTALITDCVVAPYLDDNQSMRLLLHVWLH